MDSSGQVTYPEAHHCRSVPAVCFRGVGFRYESDWALEDADFDIEVGETVCVIGPNGGGKTTLLRLALGLLIPERGEVRIFGEPPSQASPWVGYVPQRLGVDRLFPVTALEVVALGVVGRSSFGGFKRRDRERAREALAAVGLEERAARLFGNLSGGEQQGVLLARALVGEPRLLVLDEPTTHIDPAAAERLQALIGTVAKGRTVITVSHDLNLVAAHVGRVLCVNRRVRMHPTVVLEGGLAEDLFGRPVRIVRHGEESPTDHRHGGAGGEGV